MSNESVSVSGPISVRSDAKERVAFDLMEHIGNQCFDSDQAAQKTKDYWLKLYQQCLKATKGVKLE
jgi:hypothetical protein